MASRLFTRFLQYMMVFAALALLAPSSLLAQTSSPASANRGGNASSWKMPRTAEGKPNFEGDWVNNTFTPPMPAQTVYT